MKNLKVIYRKNNKWFTGKINEESKLRKGKEISKLSDAKNVENYISLKKYIRLGKKTFSVEETLEQFKLQSLYILQDEQLLVGKIKVGKSVESKKWWSTHNRICADCKKSCKQSARVDVISCQRMTK